MALEKEALLGTDKYVEDLTIRLDKKIITWSVSWLAC